LSGSNGTLVLIGLEELQSSNWIDGATLRTTVEYVIGNLQEDYLQVARLKVEFNSIGDATASTDFIVLPSQFLGRLTIGDGLVGVIGIIFVLFIVGELVEGFKVGLDRYLKDGWNFFELGIYALGLTWFVLLVHARKLAVNQRINFDDSNDPIDLRVLDVWNAGLEVSLAEFIVSVALMGAYLKMIKYIKYLPLIGPDMLSLLSTLLSIRVLTFTIFVAFFIISLGVGVYIRFGSQSVDFSSYGVSLLSIFGSLLGDTYFESMVGGDVSTLLDSDDNSGAKTTGVIFYIFIAFIITLILANVFINVTGSVYDDAHESSIQDWAEAVDSLMISHRWQAIRGYPFADKDFLEQLRSRVYDLICSWNQSNPSDPSSRGDGSEKQKSLGKQSEWGCNNSPGYYDIDDGETTANTVLVGSDWSIAADAKSIQEKLALLNIQTVDHSRRPTSLVRRGRRRADSNVSVSHTHQGNIVDVENALDEQHNDHVDGDVEGHLELMNLNRTQNPMHNEETDLSGMDYDDLNDYYWSLHRKKRENEKIRRSREQEKESMTQILKRIGIDVYYNTPKSWWEKEKKQVDDDQALLFWDLGIDAVEAWRVSKSNEPKKEN
jgi:hypothetical protein